MATTDTTGLLLTAAEHTVLAASHFAAAQGIHDHLGTITDSRRAQEREWHMDCADMHLRLAGAITGGAALIAAHRRALADPTARIQNTWLGNEANAWNALLAGQPIADARTRRSA
ncbi:hypothetical protein [Amycolatopsis sp. H20-H5]|uniref:hypothetical protein n=1 Tax=Amycolatopsis sp. H20-H5 TaxID=3046309 RepID=UPI002DB934E3|nr:hypothetical protein [Amycolatopsis sp. H20-H5]MEC3979914.1 hypothetical protein [Amycolatopsis sp. H20-H5]